jgi:hypothetical protein
MRAARRLNEAWDPFLDPGTRPPQLRFRGVAVGHLGHIIDAIGGQHLQLCPVSDDRRPLDCGRRGTGRPRQGLPARRRHRAPRPQSSAVRNDAFMHVAVPLRPDPDIKFGLLGAVSKTYEAAPISEIRLSQGLLRYRDLGSGPCVVPIHGLFVNSSVRDRFVPLLAQHTTGRRHRHPLDRTTDRPPSEARRGKVGP